jgi:outer membrane murein-binding lipoprotein Lpp
MTRRRCLLMTGLAALTACGLAGCTAGGPLTARRTTLGTLKADVARLEGQNQQYRAKIAQLEADTQRLGEQLAQEREFSGELAARLDDARALLARQGAPDEELARLRPRDSIERVSPHPGRTARRKPPFAQIGSGAYPIASPNEEDLPNPDDLEEIEPEDSRSALPTRDETSLRWLPVATGLSEPGAKRR